MDCLQQHKNKLLENGCKWIMNCNWPKPFSFLWAIVLFCKMPFCEVNMYMKMKNNSKEQKSKNEQEQTKVKNQKQRRIGKHEWNNSNINEGEKNKEVERKKNLMWLPCTLINLQTRRMKGEILFF